MMVYSFPSTILDVTSPQDSAILEPQCDAEDGGTVCSDFCCEDTLDRDYRAGDPSGEVELYDLEAREPGETGVELMAL